MIILSQLSGTIPQLTIHGELKFIPENEYSVTSTNTKNLVLVTGEYQIDNGEETIQAAIQMLETELSKF